MNLQDFIKETLIQIARGIEGAAAELKNSKAIVNPRNVQTGAGDDPNVYGFLDTQTKFCKTVQKVEFDVAVTAWTGTATKVASMLWSGRSAWARKANRNLKIVPSSRIKFLVPMVLPMEDAPHDAQDPT